jgi:hypothetical protein
MSTAPRRGLVGAVFVLLASWAWLPLCLGGFRGEELALLAGLAHLDEPSSDGALARLLSLPGIGGHLVPALDLRLTSALFAPESGWALASAWPARLESVAWLLLTAWMLGRGARRLLQPWSGGELARAAGWATALAFALHPLSVASIASLTARGDQIALAMSATSAWTYLRGRQERDGRSLAISAAAAIVAAFSSELALALPAWLAGAEIASARRHRKLGTRMRSGAAVFAAAVVCVALGPLVQAAAGAPRAPAAAPVAAAETLGLVLERLGTLIVPVPQPVLGAAGFALAGFVMLAAVQPVFVAARSAPRLWGWMLFAAALALALAELFSRTVRVHPGDLRDAATLASGVAVISVGLGISITAMSGLRRIVLPLVLALGFTALSHAHALAYGDAAREVRALAERLRTVEGTAIVVDPPEVVEGVRALEGAGGALGDPAVSGRDAVAVRSCVAPALAAFAREEEFAELRRSGVTVLASPAALGETSRERWSAARLAQEAPSEGRTSWFRELRSPAFDLAPASVEALQVRPEPDIDPAARPVIAWSAGDGEEESGRLAGAWAYLGEAPEAVFDLSSSLAWLCGGRVRQVWTVSGWSGLQTAEFVDRLPAPGVAAEPLVADGSWRFQGSSGEPADEGDARRSWTLALLDLDRLEYVEIAVERDRDSLIARAAPAAVQRLGGRVAWSLETRIDGVAIERLRGRAR